MLNLTRSVKLNAVHSTCFLVIGAVQVLCACTSDSSSLDALSSADKNDPDKYTALVYAYETITKPDSTTCRRALQGVKFYVEDSTGMRVSTANDQVGGISSTNADGFGTFTVTAQRTTYNVHFDSEALDAKKGMGYSYLVPEKAPTHSLIKAAIASDKPELNYQIENPTSFTTNSGAINNFNNDTIYLEYGLRPDRRKGAIPESECEPYELSGGLSANAFLSNPATYKTRLLGQIEEARKAKEDKEEAERKAAEARRAAAVAQQQAQQAAAAEAQRKTPYFPPAANGRVSMYCAQVQTPGTLEQRGQEHPLPLFNTFRLYEHEVKDRGLVVNRTGETISNPAIVNVRAHETFDGATWAYVHSLKVQNTISDDRTIYQGWIYLGRDPNLAPIVRNGREWDIYSRCDFW